MIPVHIPYVNEDAVCAYLRENRMVLVVCENQGHRYQFPGEVWRGHWSNPDDPRTMAFWPTSVSLGTGVTYNFHDFDANKAMMVKLKWGGQ